MERGSERLEGCTHTTRLRLLKDPLSRVLRSGAVWKKAYTARISTDGSGKAVVRFHLMPVRLRSDVNLGELTEGCAARMLTWVKQAEVSDGLGLSRVPTMERTLAWIRTAQGKESIWAWAVLWNGIHVGNVVFDQIDRRADTARFSVYLGDHNARSCGVGTTAIYKALAKAFCDEHLHKVWLTVHAEHAAAKKAYANLGFRVEGILREAFVLGNRRLDALYMGLLAAEFSALETQESEPNR
jgi:RimJ/RimL family protein N-acetyltransferase